MNNTKKLLKTIRVFEIITITLLLLFLSYNFSYWLMSLMSSGEEDIHEQYQEKVDNCLLLQKVAEDCIEEEKEIHIENIPHDLVKYKIYNQNDNIVFEYSLKNASSYDATITLSQDYKIIKEKYSAEPEDLEDYDEYKQDIRVENLLVSHVLAILFTALIIAFGVLIDMCITPQRYIH